MSGLLFVLGGFGFIVLDMVSPGAETACCVSRVRGWGTRSTPACAQNHAGPARGLARCAGKRRQRDAVRTAWGACVV